MSRIVTVFGLFIVLYAGIVVRLFYWQVVASDALKREAATQHFFRFTLPSKRGNIVSSDGYPFVMSQNSYLVYGEPQNISDIPGFSKSVGEILNIPQASISAELTKEGRLWVPIQRKVDVKAGDQLKSLNLKGLGFEAESKRYYPESSTAAHFLGFVGYDENGQDRGYFGLEGYYDRDLKGKEGSLRIEKDVKGNPILVGQTQRIDPQDGRTIVLFVDRTVQGIVEKRLSEAITKYGAKEGSVVVMDPKTGGILGMASYPSYDPRAYTEYDKELFINPVVGRSYEPGSTFKVFVMASGIEEGVITPTTEMDEKGPVEVSGYTIRTWNDSYHGDITMTDVLKYSSNVGMVFVGDKIGKDKLLTYVKKFGFGDLTGIDLEDEGSSTIRPDKEWYPIDLATLSFGQGIAVTPIQMVRAVSALANGGYLLEPKMVKAIQEKDGKEIQIKPKVIRRVIEDETSKKITEMMVTAVEDGEAKWAKPRGYRIAGKTGTAQIPVAGHYDETKTIASFVGFAPADDAKFAILTTLREPSSSQWGSETAAPLFFAIAKDLFVYYNMPPEE